MKNGNKIFILIVVVLCNRIYAQDYKQDMLKIRECYHRYHFYRMSFNFYPYDSLPLVTDSMRAKCYMNDNSYYYKINGSGHEYEYIKNSTHYLVVDHDNKIVAIDQSSKARAEMWDIKKVDTLLTSPAMKISYREIGYNEAEYDLKYGKGIWNRLTIVFDKTNYTLTRIFMYSSEKGKMNGQQFSRPRVGIYYSDYSQSQPDNTMFLDDKYVYNTGNKIEPAKAYKGYKVLDYLTRINK